MTPPTAPANGPAISAASARTILFVDDEPEIRRVAVRALSSLGYRVLQAGDGLEALDVAADHAGPIDLLITDLIMPRMDGTSLAAALVFRCPGVRVMYTSGFVTDEELRALIAHGAVDFLPKPYVPTVLRERVRAALDEG
jgi:hypothetical protein